MTDQTRADQRDTTQLTQADVDRMRREGRNADIVQAKNDGRLNELFGLPAPIDIAGERQLTEGDVQQLYDEGRYEDIIAARDAGRLDDYLNS